MVEPGDNVAEIIELFPPSRLVLSLIDTFLKLLYSLVFFVFCSEKMPKIIVELLSTLDSPLAPVLTLFLSV